MAWNATTCSTHVEGVLPSKSNIESNIRCHKTARGWLRMPWWVQRRNTLPVLAKRIHNNTKTFQCRCSQGFKLQKGPVGYIGACERH
jgi:hypothetical protein